MSRHSRSILGPLLVVLLDLQQCLGQKCTPPQTIDFPVQKYICDGPYFINMLPKTEENLLLDNACLTAFPLPDDPNTYIAYLSYVYCDGSYSVQTIVGTQFGKGIFVAANPLGTYRDHIFAYAGCDTYIGYRCFEFGELAPPFIYGASTSCSPIGLSCLRKVEEAVKNSGLPKQDMYILPMKLPNRCITQQLCTIPPNPFYNKLGPSVGLVY